MIKPSWLSYASQRRLVPKQQKSERHIGFNGAAYIGEQLDTGGKLQERVGGRHVCDELHSMVSLIDRNSFEVDRRLLDLLSSKSPCLLCFCRSFFSPSYGDWGYL